MRCSDQLMCAHRETLTARAFDRYVIESVPIAIPIHIRLAAYAQHAGTSGKWYIISGVRYNGK